MDYSYLEKLAKLKDKGILTQEQFEAEKKKLLHPETLKEEKSQKQGTFWQNINWKNVGLSFVLMILYFIFLSLVFHIFSPEIGLILLVATPFIMTYMDIKMDSQNYKNCAPAWAVFVCVTLVGPLGLWVVIYELLQIYQGNVPLKDISERKSNKVAKILLFCLAILFVALFCLAGFKASKTSHESEDQDISDLESFEALAAQAETEFEEEDALSRN